MKRSHFILLAIALAMGPIVLLAFGSAEPEAASGPVATDPPALRPRTGERPLVVILADNAGSETTDLLVPHGILQQSGAVEVLIVATGEGPVTLMPALAIQPDMTVAQFERAHPRGADAVVVPAFHSGGTERTSAFLRGQAGFGAMIVSICEGAEPVARAGLLDGRAATTHWFAQSRMRRHHPGVEWVRDARYVIDGPVMSSSGVSASVPATLALLALLAGPDAAERTAGMLGVPGWSSAHDSSRFSLDLGTAAVALGNMARFWQHERLYAPVEDGIDGISFALRADAWSRTYRSRLVAANAAGSVVTAQGVTLLTEAQRPGQPVLSPTSGRPLATLDASLEAIAARYGQGTAGLVATQLEYAWQPEDG